MGLAQFVQPNPVKGCQLDVPPPTAVSIVDGPEVMVTFALKLAMGFVTNVTFTGIVFLHPFVSVTVTV